MRGSLGKGARFLIVAMLAPLAAACTTTTQSPTAVTNTENSASAPRFAVPRFTPVVSIDPIIAESCINAAANKYFLPASVIRVVNSRPRSGGGTDVDLQVDLRTAVCQVSAGGNVTSVIDTMPKSADQVAAEAAAAKAESAKVAVSNAKKP